MKIDAARLREHYASLSEQQLLELLGRGTLTAQALQVLDAVLGERGVPLAERARAVEKGQAHLAACDRELQLHAYLRASRGSRLIARLIDTAIVLGGSTFAAVVGVPAIAVSLFIPSLLYFMFADAMPQGQSCGKRLLSIAVVDAASLEPCTPLQAIQRNWVMRQAFGWLLTLVLWIGRGRPGFRGPTMVVRKRRLARMRG